MAFVKLDCGILDSSLWISRPQREIFITALLLAEPREYLVPIPQISVRSLDVLDFSAPPGWYGYVAAAGIGIIHRVGLDLEEGYHALDALGSPDPGSRSKAHEGRRLIRIDGGYLVLNYDEYRTRDYGAAERSRRYRERQAEMRKASRDRHAASRSVTSRTPNRTQAEGEAEAYEEEDLIVCGVPHTRHPRSASPPDPAPDSPKTPKIPDCPYSAIVDLYHERLPTLPRVVALNDIRKRHLKARWRDDPDLDSWRQFFDYVGTSKFLMGRAAPQPNRAPFIADIDFLMNDSNQLKIAEGKFHRV